MGCDIHMHVECKRRGEWVLHSEDIYDCRNYELFGILAGVRGSSEPISYIKGLPSDVTDDVKSLYDSWEGGAHSASWLTFNEIYNSRFYYENASLQHISFDMRRAKREAQAEDVRIVFWFDS